MKLHLISLVCMADHSENLGRNFPYLQDPKTWGGLLKGHSDISES